MKEDLESHANTEKSWGPYQLRANPVAILRLSLGTAGAIATTLLIPDVFALIPSAPDALTLCCRAIGDWGYCYVLWSVGFLCILHLVRIFGGSIVLDEEGIKLGRVGHKVAWDAITAIAIAERKLFSRAFFIPSYQMTLHFLKPNGKRSTKQIASFQYLPREFFSLFHHMARFSTGARVQSIDAYVFKNIVNADLRQMYDDGRLKSAALTGLIAFGLMSFLARNAVKTYTFNMGMKEFRQGHYDKAISHFATVTAVEFSYAPAWDFLARSEFRLGDLESAQSDWKTALRWKPDYVEAKLGLSMIDMLQGNLEEADKLIATATRLAPMSEATYINRAQVDLLMGKTRATIDNLQSFIRQNVGRHQAICILAQAYIREGQLGKAAVLLKSNELMSDPYTRDLCIMRQAELSLAEGNLQRADQLFASIRTEANHQPDLLVDLATLDSIHDRFISAHNKLNRAAAMNPGGPWIALAKAQLAAKEGDPKAEEYTKEALKFKYEAPCIMAACASFLAKRGKQDAACELARRAIKLDPYNVIAAEVIKATQKPPDRSPDRKDAKDE